MFTDLPHRPHGAMPSGWTSTRLGNLGSLRKGRGGSRQDDDATGAACIRYGDLYKVDRPSMKNPVTRISTSSVEGYTQISRGDVLFALSGESQADIGKSSVSLIEEPTYCGGDTAVFSAIAISAEFLGHALTAPYLLKQKRQLGRGDIIVHISTGSLEQLTVLVPPAEEQAAIVKYLGHAHARIDRAIAAKRKMIALLEEQKQAIIHQAVTRGLDPSVPLKDSGIPWLGEIPVHWDRTRLKFLISSGPTNGTSPQISERGDLETISISAVRDGVLSVKPTDVKFVSRSDVPNPFAYVLRAGDVVLVRGNGNIKLVGRAAEVLTDRPDSIYPDLLIRIRPSTSNDPRFMTMVLNSPTVRSQIELAARTSVGTFKVSGGTVRNLVLPHPGIAEQRKIVDSVESRARDIDSSRDIARREIELLQEFRTRLTSDVVTGQVDVRTIAASLPDLTDDVIADTDIDAELDDMLDSELDPEGTNG